MIRKIRRYSLMAGLACIGMALATVAWAQRPHAPGKAAESWNMRLVGHHPMQGRSIYKGHVQEQDGRFIAYVGHHRGNAFNPLTGDDEPNGNSIVDVTDPTNPVFLKHLPPRPETGGNQSRNLQTCAGDDLPNGESGKYYLLREVSNRVHEIWDVTDPASPDFLVAVQHTERTHKNWWECSTGIAYLTSRLPAVEDWGARVMSIFDLSNPTDPIFIRHYIGLPGAQPGGDRIGRRMTSIHEPLYLDGKVYMAYGTRSDGIFQILDNDELLNGSFDPLSPTEEELLAPVISRLDWPDFQGVHTAVPILGMELSEFEDFDAGTPRDFVVVVNESTRNECTWDMHQMVYLVDITDPVHPIPVSTFFVPEASGNFCERGGRFGAHSMQWNITETNYHGRIAWISYFNAGVRGVDIRDPYNPREVAYYIPAVTENTTERCVGEPPNERCKTAIQTNNVDVDDRGFVYIFDRANTGMHILEPTGQARKIANF